MTPPGGIFPLVPIQKIFRVDKERKIKIKYNKEKKAFEKNET